MLAGELLGHVNEVNPAAICVTVLPSRGLTHARYVCKRLRSAFPDLKVIVCCPGLTGNVERVRERLQAAGADSVAATLADCRAQISSHVRLLAHTSV
jgi:hypothetical protein